MKTNIGSLVVMFTSSPNEKLLSIIAEPLAIEM